MKLVRDDRRVRTTDGVELRIRTVEPESVPNNAPVIVLVHGIAAPLEPTYDLPVPGYSFMAELAARGFRVVAFDHRNFGASVRAPAMSEPPRPLAPSAPGLQTLDDSVEDIRAVVMDAVRRFGVERVTVFGSSRGAIQVLAYAASAPPHLELAILNNPSSLCYLSGVVEGPLLADLAQERRDAARLQNYIPYTAEYQRKRWQKLFGEQASVAGSLQEAYIQACLQSDLDGSKQNPAVFRVPTETFPERVPLIHVEEVQAPVLVIEAEDASAAHVEALLAKLARGRFIFIRGSNHFTLRNDHRFELANLIDLAVTSSRWGRRP